jgi:hypothetical protein
MTLHFDTYCFLLHSFYRLSIDLNDKLEHAAYISAFMVSTVT